jgi:hypothetical protein
MKKYIFLWLLLPVWVSAQNREIVEAASGEDLTKKVSTHMQYLFPEFTSGDVYYKGSPKGSGMMNYNMLAGEMQFVEDGKLLALANVKDVILVNIDNRKFYPFNDKEFVEEIVSTGKVQLRVRRRGNVAQHSKKGAYGTSSSTSSITSYSSINSDNRQYNLTVEENVLITLNRTYYLVGLNGKYTVIKNRKTFSKQFPGHDTQIESFVKEQQTRFDNEDDLKALMEYCSKLNH